MKKYTRFKRWVEQKKVQWILDIFNLGAISFLVVVLIFFNGNENMLSRVLGISKQEIAIPTQAPEPTAVIISPYEEPTATPTVLYKQVKGAQQKTSLIDCTGPDGKHFRTTQKECDVFNAAWSKSTPTIIPPQNRTSTSTSSNNVYCWDNIYHYGYYTNSGDKCNSDNARSLSYKTCTDTQKLKNDSCNSECKRKENEDSGICAWAYTGQNAGVEQNSDKYGECLNGTGGAGEKYATCLGKCGEQYANDIKQCN